jgi:hypothetical protein
MKTELTYFILVLICSCNTSKSEKYINVNDFRTTDKPEINLNNYQDKDLDVSRIKFDTLEAYAITTFRTDNNQLKYYTDFYIGSGKEFDLASYKWINDSTLIFKLINTANNLTETYSLIGYGDKGANLSLLDVLNSNDYRPNSGDILTTSTFWSNSNYKNGNNPGCYNYIAAYSDSLDNELQVKVGSNADVVIKLVNFETNLCIRYVYIRKGTTFAIDNIPEGKYYLKIAYGSDWRLIIIDGQCIGRFILKPLYRRGEQILDFNKVYTGTVREGNYEYKNYVIPSFTLFLDVIYSDVNTNIFPTNEISESEFNK